MRDLVSDFLIPVAVIGAFMAVLMGTIFGLANWHGGAQCAAISKAMGVEHRYGFVEDCLIKVPPKGQWVPLKNYRVP